MKKLKEQKMIQPYKRQIFDIENYQLRNIVREQIDTILESYDSYIKKRFKNQGIMKFKADRGVYKSQWPN